MSDQQPERVPAESKRTRGGSAPTIYDIAQARRGEPLDGVARAQPARPDQREDRGAHPGWPRRS